MLTGNKRDWVLFLELVILPCDVHGPSPSFYKEMWYKEMWTMEKWVSKATWSLQKVKENKVGLGRMRESASIKSNPRRPCCGHSPEEVPHESCLSPETLPVGNR